LVTSALLLAR